MRTVCWQTILMKYHNLFFLKIRKDVTKFVVCCSRDWRFKGSYRHVSCHKCNQIPNSYFLFMKVRLYISRISVFFLPRVYPGSFVIFRIIWALSKYHFDILQDRFVKVPRDLMLMRCVIPNWNYYVTINEHKSVIIMRVTFTFTRWVIAYAFSVVYWYFSKLIFSKKLFQKYHQSVMEVKSRSLQTFCQNWSGSKVIAKCYEGSRQTVKTFRGSKHMHWFLSTTNHKEAVHEYLKRMWLYNGGNMIHYFLGKPNV